MRVCCFSEVGVSILIRSKYVESVLHTPSCHLNICFITFSAVKISKVLFSQCANNKRFCRHTLYSTQRLRYSRTNENSMFFYRWIWNSFHFWDIIFRSIFIRASHLQKYQKSCLTREINFIFNVKPLNNLCLSYSCLKWKQCQKQHTMIYFKWFFGHK